MTTSAEVVVAGAGIIGLSIARELAARGARVAVLERGRAGRGATGAAAGVLSPTDAREWEDDLGELNERAIAEWPAWASGLADETGSASGYEARGEIRVGPLSAPFLSATVEGTRRWGWRCERLDGDELARLEPGVAAGDLDALHLPDTAAVDTQRLVAALVESCRRRTAELREGCAVEALDHRRRAVRLAGGETIAYSQLVVATGAWSARWLPPELCPDVRPLLGESLVARAPGEPLCTHAIRSPAGSIVPRQDGSYWIGTTVLERGFQEAPSIRSLRTVANNAARLIPALDEALFVEARSGLRPVTADGLPVMGPAAEGLVLATGHGREGIIQAPTCARLIARGIVDGDWQGLSPAFRPGR